MKPFVPAPITPPFWNDKPVVIVGAGPSLKGFDFNRLRDIDCYVLAVKGAMWDLPFADCCIGIDRRWMEFEAERIEQVAQRIPVYLTVQKEEYDRISRKIPSARYIELIRRGNIFQKTRVECGSTSGFAALNFTFIRDAKLMVLLGYDYNKGGGHYDDKAHRHALASTNAELWPTWAKYYDGLVPQIESAGITVLNAAPESTIPTFKKVTHDQALEFVKTWPR